MLHSLLVSAKTAIVTVGVHVPLGYVAGTVLLIVLDAFLELDLHHVGTVVEHLVEEELLSDVLVRYA